VIEKQGTEIVIPLQDINPAGYSKPLKVKAYIDNYFAGSIKLVDDSWYNLNLKIPDFTGKRITLTLVSSRSWVPKEIGLKYDTRS
jgi:hypothetical protein